MVEADAPPDVHIQHDAPPVFYCWKYWLVTGEFHQGCTPVESSPENFLDLNDYGWVYILIPILGLFLLVFVFYCCCRGNSSKAKAQPIMSEESDSEDEEVFRTRGKSSAAYRGVPVRNSDARNYYTVVPIDPHNPQKMSLQGGIDASHPGYPPQQRLYPRLTAMRHQAGLNGAAGGKTAGNGKAVPAGKVNDYQPEPAPIKEPKVADNKAEESDDSSSDESEK